MSEVYIVTAGRYSDYAIQAVFSTIEKARDYAKTIPYRDADIEAWEMDVAKMRTQYLVELDRAGNEIRRWAHQVSTEWESPQKDDEITSGAFPRASGSCSFYGRSFRSYDVALKAARAKRAEYLAKED